jgi:hypothetical protein
MSSQLGLSNLEQLVSGGLEYKSRDFIIFSLSLSVYITTDLALIFRARKKGKVVKAEKAGKSGESRRKQIDRVKAVKGGES